MGREFLCTQNHGMSELCGQGVAGECEGLCGIHINEDWFIPEVIDPKTGKCFRQVRRRAGYYLPWEEALPLVRYRTGDLTRLLRTL